MTHPTDREREFQSALMTYLHRYRRAHTKPARLPARDWIAPLFTRMTSLVVTLAISSPAPGRASRPR